MSAGNQLTTLSNVKGWLGINETETDSDEMLTRLIKVASAFVLNYLGRDSFDLTTYSDLCDGYGNQWVIIRRGPVYQVHSVSFSGVPVSRAQGDGITTPYTGGWSLENEHSSIGPQRLNFFGRTTPRQRSSVYIQYDAGYVITEKHYVVLVDGVHRASTFQLWLNDVSVVNLADNFILTKVEQNPGPGEYTVSEGVYIFNASDADAFVSISYSYVPADVVQAATEMVGERYRYLDRIGQTSKSLGGQETVSYSQEPMSRFIRELLAPYKSVVPV